MSDPDVEKVVIEAAAVTPPVEPALLKRIVDSIDSSVLPVRPRPPTWALTGGLALICTAVAGAAAAGAGFYGIEKLGRWEGVLIVATIGVLVWVAGMEFVRQLIPGSRQPVGVGAFLTIACAALLGVFALVFRDYHTEHFIPAGIACLRTGLLVAIPAALLSWVLLRRGFAVNPVAAGLVGGALAGLSGVTMLELHCANFEALHVLVWHTAVVPVSAGAGALVGWALRRRRPTESS